MGKERDTLRSKLAYFWIFKRHAPENPENPRNSRKIAMKFVLKIGFSAPNWTFVVRKRHRKTRESRVATRPASRHRGYFRGTLGVLLGHSHGSLFGPWALFGLLEPLWGLPEAPRGLLEAPEAFLGPPGAPWGLPKSRTRSNPGEGSTLLVNLSISLERSERRIASQLAPPASWLQVGCASREPCLRQTPN